MRLSLLTGLVALLWMTGVARGQEPLGTTTPSVEPATTGDGGDSERPKAEPGPTPPPYALPWQLRPAAAATVLRSDTAASWHDGGTTQASMLLASYALTPEIMPLIRVGVVHHAPSAGAAVSDSGTAFLNPVVGGTYVLKLPNDLRLAPFLAVALPFGQGGGDSPDPAKVVALPAGILTRSAMDNAMFAVNYLTVFPGVGLAYVKSGLTVQAEVTILQLRRVRGAVDDNRTNFTAGLFAGYFFIKALSVGLELRHQRWLSTPAGTTSTTRDNTTFAAGLRGHVKLSETTWLRPGLSYTMGLDDPMGGMDYRILQIDVPVIF